MSMVVKELKAALTGSTRRAKGSPPKKAHCLKKERRLLYAPILKLQKDEMSGGDEVDDE
jgi:hypothetical protein